MKAIFVVSAEVKVIEQLKKIAQKYKKTVKLGDDGESHFILAKPKLQIKERMEDKKYTINVWGAKEGDMLYLKQFWGEPVRTAAEGPSPVEFATELINIPKIHNKMREEIMEIMELNERQYDQYKRLLWLSAKRSIATEEILEAYQIMKQLDQT